jgi:hypothetical protein
MECEFVLTPGYEDGRGAAEWPRGFPPLAACHDSWSQLEQFEGWKGLEEIRNCKKWQGRIYFLLSSVPGVFIYNRMWV